MSWRTRRSEVSEPDGRRGPREPERVKSELEANVDVQEAECEYGDERPAGDERVRRRDGMLSCVRWLKFNDVTRAW